MIKRKLKKSYPRDLDGKIMVQSIVSLYLPDSIRDEKGSHGFVKFAIKPKKTLTKDEAIRNTGYIYFDYNPAIVTNTVETANQKNTSLFTPSVAQGILKLSPNPTQETLNFEIDNPSFQEGNLSIYDLAGRLILTKRVFNKTENLSVKNLNSGQYICVIQSNDGKIYVNKFIKVK